MGFVRTNTHNRFTALLEYVGTTRVSRYQKGKTKKVKTNLDLLEQEIVSGSGTCWDICNDYSLRTNKHLFFASFFLSLTENTS